MIIYRCCVVNLYPGSEFCISIIVPPNTGSRRVAEKIGMQLEKDTVWKGVEVCVYSALRSSCQR